MASLLSLPSPSCPRTLQWSSISSQAIRSIIPLLTSRSPRTKSLTRMSRSSSLLKVWHALNSPHASKTSRRPPLSSTCSTSPKMTICRTSSTRSHQERTQASFKSRNPTSLTQVRRLITKYPIMTQVETGKARFSLRTVKMMMTWS